MIDEENYEEMEKEAKEYAQGNFYSEQGFLYGYERGFAEGRKEAESHLLENWCRNEDDYCPHLKKLEAQIEKMKCCMNCNKLRTCLQYIKLFKLQVPDELLVDYGCIDGEKWESVE